MNSSIECHPELAALAFHMSQERIYNDENDARRETTAAT